MYSARKYVGVAITAFLCVLVVAHAAAVQPLNDTYYAVVAAESGWSLVQGDATAPGAVAYGKMTDLMLQAGMAKLFVHATNSTGASSLDQAEASGFLEGALSANVSLAFLENFDIWKHVAVAELTPLGTFIKDWDSFLVSQIDANGNADPYWRHVQLLRAQLQGMADGHNAVVTDSTKKLSYFHVLFVNGMIEWFNVLTAIAMRDLSSQGEVPYDNYTAMKSARDAAAIAMVGKPLFDFLSELQASMHCSSLVKLLPDNSDVYFSHTTWSMYRYMTRVWKLYDLPFNDNLLTGTQYAQQVSFSSYPLYIDSMDDFYVTSNKLGVTETTNELFNFHLFAQYTVPNGTVPVFLRAAASTRIARSSAEWCSTFARYNSGTYNNQWIVFDYKLFVPGQLPAAGALYVAEQIPGYIHIEDLTDTLNSQTYWSSFNVPYYSDIYNMSHYPELYALTNGSAELTHDHCARALIFDRDQDTVVDSASMRKLMRYNDYQHDPLSQDNPTLAIASRFDLLTNIARIPMGGLDGKITSSQQVEQLQWDSVSGPTCDQQPVFVWSTSPFASVPHTGMADAFNFPWITNVMQE